MLIVAEKYQTGFDEPLLHTMFRGQEAVRRKGCADPFPAESDNARETRYLCFGFCQFRGRYPKSFEPYYEETILEQETDPNVVYDLKNTLDDYHVFQQMEIDRFAEVFYSNQQQSMGDTGRLHSFFKPALDRFEALEPERQDLFKSTLARFNRIYAFITQVCRLFDKEIHKFSVYAKFLYTMLPKGGSG